MGVLLFEISVPFAVHYSFGILVGCMHIEARQLLGYYMLLLCLVSFIVVSTI